MFWPYKLSFVVDIFFLFRLGDSLGYFLNNWTNFFFKSSGHPERDQHLTGENPELVLAEFSTLSKAVSFQVKETALNVSGHF